MSKLSECVASKLLLDDEALAALVTPLDLVDLVVLFELLLSKLPEQETRKNPKSMNEKKRKLSFLFTSNIVRQ